MLDLFKLMHTLQEVKDTLYVDHTSTLECAYQLWNEVIAHEALIKNKQQEGVHGSFLYWQQSLGFYKSLSQRVDEYQIYAIDGSQVYPDVYNAFSCMLINIGVASMNYHCSRPSTAFLQSHPAVIPYSFLEYDITPIERVNLERTAHEFEWAAQHALSTNFSEPSPFLYLFDGMLTWWFLTSHTNEVQHIFFNRYMRAVETLYQQKKWYASYVSMPHTKELMHFMNWYALNFKNLDVSKEWYGWKQLIDTQLLHKWLSPFSRTTFFKCSGPSIAFYPEHLQPYFCYLHVGTEIVRLEVPAWIVNNPEWMDVICMMCIDQSIKGNGYPISLAEAHEQAVIAHTDRDFFLTILESYIPPLGQRILSQKNNKKIRKEF